MKRVLGNLWVSKPRYMPGFGTPQILPQNEGFREGNLVKICKEVLNIAGFIEEFYYGNIDPQARSTKQNKKVQREMEVLMNTEEILTKELNDEHKKCFLDFANAWNVVNAESNLDSFIMGFRLGANFAYDAFVSTESPFEDLVKG